MLHILRQPSNTTGLGFIVTQPIVAVKDFVGRLVDNDVETVVTASIVAVSGRPAWLRGSSRIVAFSGIARFTDLVIDGIEPIPFKLKFSAFSGFPLQSIVSEELDSRVPLKVSSILHTNRPTTGSASITLLGIGFGTQDFTPRVRALYSTCEASEWTSDSSLRCKIHGGEGGLHTIELTTGVQQSTITLSFSFDSPSTSSVLESNLPSTGSRSVTITGSGFSTPF